MCAVVHFTVSCTSQPTAVHPQVMWEEHNISIQEGETDRQLCFTSDIGTAEAYEVIVSVRYKGANPATGKAHILVFRPILLYDISVYT